MPEESRVATSQPEPMGERRPRSRKLPALLALGVLAICLALFFRNSDWAREYRYKKASLPVLKSWMSIHPRDPLLFYYLGTKSYNDKALGDAGAYFQNAVSLDAKMSRAHVGLALVQRDIGQLPEAYASAKQAQTLDPKNPDTQFLVALLVMRSSESRAIEEFRKVTIMAPKRADGWYYLGLCHDGVNQKGEAIEALRKAGTLDAKNALYQRDLGRVQLDMNLLAEARTALETARELAPQDAETHYLLGATQLKLARTDEEVKAADALFQLAEELLPREEGTKPAYASISLQRAEVAKRLRQPKQALAHLKRVPQFNPRDISHLYAQAEALRMLGDEAQARRLMDRYTRLSAEANAASQMEQRIKQDPKDPKLRLQIARIYARNKDYPRAVNQYEYCLYLDPRHAAAKRELEALKLRLSSSESREGRAKP